MECFHTNDTRFWGETDSITIQNAINAAAGSHCRSVLIPRLNEIGRAHV